MGRPTERRLNRDHDVARFGAGGLARALHGDARFRTADPGGRPRSPHDTSNGFRTADAGPPEPETVLAPPRWRLIAYGIRLAYSRAT